MRWVSGSNGVGDDNDGDNVDAAVDLLLTDHSHRQSTART